MAKSTTIKNKQTAEEAAISVLQKAKEAKIEAATKELNIFLDSWKIKHKCDFIVIGHFRAGQIETGLEIVVK